MPNIQELTVGNDIRQSKAYGGFMKLLGWKVETLKSKNTTQQIFLKKIGPWHIAKMQRYKGLPEWQQLNDILKKYKVFMCQLESGEWIDEQSNEDEKKSFFNKVDQDMRSHGFKMTRNAFLGNKTKYLDLNRSDQELLNSFSADARRKIRQLVSENHKIVMNEYQNFHKLFQTAFKKKHIWCAPWSYVKNITESFGDKCFSVNINNECGCLVVVNGPVADYLYAWTLTSGKDSNSPYLLIWTAIHEAQKRGAKVWDFEGMYDIRFKNKGWKNFSQFKSRFHGVNALFPPDYIRWRLPL